MSCVGKRHSFIVEQKLFSFPSGKIISVEREGAIKVDEFYRESFEYGKILV